MSCPCRQSVCVCRQRVGEDVVILLRLVVKKVSTHAEIERATEIRGQTEFLAQLPGVFIGQILYNKPI